MERRNEARTMGTYRPVGREEQKQTKWLYIITCIVNFILQNLKKNINI